MEKKDVLSEQIALMEQKLLEEGKKMPDESLIVGYDNGGGQSGVRENPYFPAYEKLLNSYIKALVASGNAQGEKNEAEVVSLDAIRSKFKIAK